MSTSEHRAVDAESDLPLSAAELSALASQLYAASFRPGPDSPPQSAPVAPRGSVPDTTAATSAGQTAAGSADLYETTRRPPSASVNFVTAHDGFTLQDLVSYEQKHNEANGEENRDGADDNQSWNCGAEGPTDDKATMIAHLWSLYARR